MELETAAHCYPTSPLANHILAKTKNGRTHVVFAMRLRPDLTLKRVSANTRIISNNSFRNSRIFRDKANAEEMEPKSNQESIKEDNIKKKDEEEKQTESKKILPPPPEKPEPGDCCGSGCVRCVWDVYYEELEAYNNLYKSDSPNSKSN